MKLIASESANRPGGLRAQAPILGVLGLVIASVGAYGLNIYYLTSAPPVASVVRLVETDPNVARALGRSVDVSVLTNEILRRDVIRRGGRDRVNVVTSVKGSDHDARLHLDATNVNDQGWTGSFSLDLEGLAVMRDGQSVTENGGTILRGTFAPDGTAIVAAR